MERMSQSLQTNRAFSALALSSSLSLCQDHRLFLGFSALSFMRLFLPSYYNFYRPIVKKKKKAKSKNPLTTTQATPPVQPQMTLRGRGIRRGNKIFGDFEKGLCIIPHKLKYTSGSEFLPGMFIVEQDHCCFHSDLSSSERRKRHSH